jgi:hypothetical protein
MLDDRMSKNTFNAIIIILATLAFYIYVCIFFTVVNRITPEIPTPTPTAQPTQTSIPYIAPAPVSPQYPVGATAICKDGTYSYSQHRRGTCSHHGGVAIWLR